MVRSRKKLGEYLVAWGVLTEEQLGEALKVKAGTGKRLGATLLEMEYASEGDITKALASQYGLEYYDLASQDVAELVNVELMPEDLVRKFLILPIEKSGLSMKVITHDPMDLDLVDTLRFRLGCEIDPVLASRTDIQAAISKIYDGEAAIVEGGEDLDLSEITEVEEQDAGGANAANAANAPIVRLVHKVIADAVLQRASDIHIEPMADRVRVRYRIDGVCHERDPLPKRMQNSIITRIKILSGMKIDERRIPQDGRMKLKIEKERVDFRVSVCPAYHGESVVARVLRSDAVRVGLVDLGLEADMLAEFNQAIRRPNGIFLVTGPTGSGKTTTLYSALDALNRPDRKIITAEDPVEYNFTGINQCQIRDDIGLTFPSVLRAMLRQAPNVILVGEIRDKAVAEIAIQASLTGHLVFSTLHTNDAPSAITRLIDMGVKPFLVASSVQAIMAQRLIRVLCPSCKEVDESPNPLHLKLCGIKPEDLAEQQIYKAVGCPDCGNTGYRGRRGIFEYMPMSSDVRELAFSRAPATQIRAAAMASGMHNLVADGRAKILKGITTPEEISRVAQVDGISADG